MKGQGVWGRGGGCERSPSTERHGLASWSGLAELVQGWRPQ